MDDPRRDEGPDALAAVAPGADLGWCLGVILRRWTELVEEAVAGVPHGTRGYQILSVVGHHEPPTQSGLAKHLRIDKTVMPYVIDALEQAGLVERRMDPTDRRVRRIALTPHGRATLADLEGKVRAAEDAVFDGVPDDARREFTQRAGELAATVHGAQPALDPCLAVRDALTDPSLAAGSR
ncbi:winged helix-turn-helix transcriptional regulator [Cellulomonas sp. zg-ZUI199]|uniref:Winged helix-turn-helix transcriptional regulator n=1 Tax=Cellulomonas wangleii TaxID=2816956 RepID=A0ABX8D6R7_9CELL|nr:MarR family winged helix-turn-helix transcriptional regulator [Cellulomonas wangleii]MBO0926767.1 winged helix-turn-helix transcriptional regulator [Cellulomonas wangleii]QVI63125.1 winged helix-turn-helix transcriptional regulator [Cellulomonas wangleii]